MKLQTIDWAEGIMFADISTATDSLARWNGPAIIIVHWRLSFGGRVLAVTHCFDPTARSWTWPVLPVRQLRMMEDHYERPRDIWATGTAIGAFDCCPKHMPRAHDERQHRKGKSAHRLLWANRNEQCFLTDPLRRREFASLAEMAVFQARVQAAESAKQVAS